MSTMHMIVIQLAVFAAALVVIGACDGFLAWQDHLERNDYNKHKED